VAEELNRSVKSVDNALQRVKNKLEKLISNENGLEK
jgi:DNA-directed RNA polymerase specialized sigma24 family protein